jgi:hypothetical protein
VLVKVRADDQKSDGLPDMMPVAHMIPAGMVVLDGCYAPSFLRKGDDAPVRFSFAPLACALDGCDLFDVSDFNQTPQRDQPHELLSKHRIELVESALLRALFTLLFVKEQDEIDADIVLAEIDVELRDDATGYLARSGIVLLGITDAFELFNALCELCPPDTIPELMNDQEARMAVLRSFNGMT